MELRYRRACATTSQRYDSCDRSREHFAQPLPIFLDRSPVSSRPEMVCQLFFVGAIIEASSGEPRRLSALR